MTQHTLKCWPQFFDATAAGSKTFELRQDDRGFQRDDTLLLIRTMEDNWDAVDWTPETTGLERVPRHTLTRRITYILHGGQFGLAPGFCILALAEE